MSFRNSGYSTVLGRSGVANPNPSPETRFKPGNTFGSGGRPREGLTEMLRAFLREEDPKTKRTYGEEVVRALVRGARRGRPVATNQLWDRIEGKVPDAPPAPDQAADAWTTAHEVSQGEHGDAEPADDAGDPGGAEGTP